MARQAVHASGSVAERALPADNGGTATDARFVEQELPELLPLLNGHEMPYSSMPVNAASAEWLRNAERVEAALHPPPSRLEPDIWDEVLTKAGMERSLVVARCEALRRGAAVDMGPDTPIAERWHTPNAPSLFLHYAAAMQKLNEEIGLGQYIAWPDKVVLPVFICPLGAVLKPLAIGGDRELERAKREHNAQCRALARSEFECVTRRIQWAMPPKPPCLDFDVKLRIIHDQRAFNDRGAKRPFDQDTINAFLNAARPGWWGWCADLLHAYKQVRVLQGQLLFMGCVIGGDVYVACKLPFGARASPFQYTQVLGRTVLWLAVRYANSERIVGFIMAYVDDFAGTAPDESTALAQYGAFTRALKDLDVPVADEKTQLPRQTDLRLLGFIVDFVVDGKPCLRVSVPPLKLARLREKLRSLSGSHRVSVKGLQSIAGTLAHIGVGVQGAASYSAEFLTLLRKNAHLGDGKLITLPSSLFTALQWWSIYAQHWNGVEIVRRSPGLPPLHAYADAAGDEGPQQGTIGLFLFGVALEFSELDVTLLDIAARETLAGVLLHVCLAALYSGTELAVNGELIGMHDNTNAVAWIAKGRCILPGREFENSLLRWRWAVLTAAKCSIDAVYVPSVENKADAPSRRLSADALACARTYANSLPPTRPVWWPGSFPFPARPRYVRVSGGTALGAFAERLCSDDARGTPDGVASLASVLLQCRAELGAVASAD